MRVAGPRAFRGDYVGESEGGTGAVPEIPWWKRGVIYQVGVSSFADSDGDGRGDLRGILDRLDYLNDGTDSSLGVDVVWLTPVNTSPMRDFGYDISDYYSIDPRFGTMQDFEDLIAACHERGMRVMMDLVLNHTSDEHPWFVESRSSRGNARRDWYVWRDGRGRWSPPNRWRAAVEGSAWEYDAATGQYYYHAFMPFQPDLNWRNDEVRRAMFGVAAFWLDKGVDGFRLDLINFLYEDELLRDNPFKWGTRPYLAQVHLHDFSQPESLEAIRELRCLSDRYADRVLMGEVFSDTPVDCVTFMGDGTDALHMSFYLDFVRRKWSAREYRDSVGWLEEHIPPDGWPCYFLNNHDLKRTYGRLGGRRDADAKARVTAAMLLTLRGTPIIYNGEEIGMPTAKVPKRLMDDPMGRKFWPLQVGRDGSRTPMHWSAADNAGFSSSRPWLPVDPSHVVGNVEQQVGSPGSLLDWYRRLIALRRSRPALQVGRYRPIDGVPDSVYAYLREAGPDEVAVFLNFSRRAAEIPGPLDVLEGGAWRVLISSHDGAGERADHAGVRLRPYEVLLLGRIASRTPHSSPPAGA
jgi:alpha-glucosidase